MFDMSLTHMCTTYTAVTLIEIKPDRPRLREEPGSGFQVTLSELYDRLCRGDLQQGGETDRKEHSGEMNQSLFICPICRRALYREMGAYRCEAGHSFDIAREGYVNLLPANQKHSGAPGDDREMVNARTRFLDGGWYAPLRECLCETAALHTPDKPVLIDAGCGEGYYTAALSTEISAKKGRTAGIDLSKTAVKRASRRCPQAEIGVASVYHLPLKDACADVVVDCFSPLAEKEFCRILKPEGFFIYVVPGRQHLWELKEILYERPYENEVREETYEGFKQHVTVPLEFRFRLENPEDISALFHMTPYAWKTPKNGVERLAKLEALDVTAQFRVVIYQKKR